MTINWQDVFYITASLAMVAVFITCLWSLWFFFIASRVVRGILRKAQQWDNNVDKIRFFIVSVESKFTKFLLNILDASHQNKKGSEKI